MLDMVVRTSIIIFHIFTFICIHQALLFHKFSNNKINIHVRADVSVLKYPNGQHKQNKIPQRTTQPEQNSLLLFHQIISASLRYIKYVSHIAALIHSGESVTDW